MQEKNINLFDIDKTLTRGYVIFDIIKEEEDAGLLSSSTYSEIMQFHTAYSKGDLGYEEFAKMVLIKWGQGLVGKKQEDLIKHSESWVESNLPRFHSFVPALFELLKEHENWLITAEADFVANAIAKKIGVSGAIGTRYEQYGTLFSGGIHQMMASRQDKQIAVMNQFKNYPIKVRIAMGDSDADIDILSLAEIPICINPSAKLNRIALERKWLICDETNVLSAVANNM